MNKRLAIGVAASLICAAGAAFAQAPPPAAIPPVEYGPTITSDQAKVVIAAAEAEARRLNTPLSFAIAEPNGEIVFMEHMTGAHYASIDNAEDRARSAARWRRPTGFWNTVNPNLITLQSIAAGDGGELIMAGGKAIGAIGVSGGAPAEGAVAKLAAMALK